MDLGCGVGLIGLIALLNNSTVHFQDYVRIIYERRIEKKWAMIDEIIFVECRSTKIRNYSERAIEF